MSGLNAGEREVLKLTAQGMTEREMRSLFGMRKLYIRVCKQEIIRKLEAVNITNACAIAATEKII